MNSKVINHNFKEKNIYENKSLYKRQKAHKTLFSAPNGSLVSWGINKIDYYHQNQITKINYGYANIMSRVIAAAMPIFALLDALQFIGKTFVNLVALKPKKALDALIYSIKALILCPTSLFAIPFSIADPKLIYRSDKLWKELMKTQTEIDINNDLKFIKWGNNQKDKLNFALAHNSRKLIKDEKALEKFDQIREKIIQEIPDDLEKQEMVIKQYIKLYSSFLIESMTNNAPFNQVSNDYISLIEQVLKIRKPTIRMKLLDQIIQTLVYKNIIVESWTKIKNEEIKKESRQSLASFIVRSITNDRKLLMRVLSVTDDTYFKNRIRSADFTASLYDIYESEISTHSKEQLLNELFRCFEKDQEIILFKKKQKEIENLRNQLQAKIQRKENYIKNTKSNKNQDNKDLIKKLEGIISKKEQEKIVAVENKDVKKVKKLSRNIEGLNKKINSLKNKTGKDNQNKNNNLKKIKFQIQSIESKINELEKNIIKTENYDNDLGTFGHYEAAQKNLETILCLGDVTMTQSYIDKIGHTKTFSLLSSPYIINTIITTVFDITNAESNQKGFTNTLRAPWALALFHSRLKEVKGKERNKLLEVSKNILQTLMKAYSKSENPLKSLWSLRHQETNNSHLEKVFSSREQLKRKWMNPPKNLTVKDLYPQSSCRFDSYKVINCLDPTDILLIGNDMNTCVNLNGRINRVKGLIGFLRDGKTHTIVAKNIDGKIAAETQLQLMWDTKNDKPVLFVEQVNFEGKEDKDYSLENALYNYAKRRAKELNLDLVSAYEFKDPNKKLLGNVYDGKVESLGSSAPLEYVNVFFGNKKKTYNLGKTYLIQAAPKTY